MSTKLPFTLRCLDYNFKGFCRIHAVEMTRVGRIAPCNATYRDDVGSEHNGALLVVVVWIVSKLFQTEKV